MLSDLRPGAFGISRLKQGGRVLEKIQEVDESIAIIARQMQRQIERRVAWGALEWFGVNYG